MESLSKVYIIASTVLMITDVQVRCSADAGASGGKNSQTIPPVITRHPQSMVVKRSKTVRLDCVAEGYPNPRISWYKDGKPLIEKSKVHTILTGELIFYAVGRSDQGTYQCVAKNSDGEARSRNATLVVAYIKDEFRRRPYDRAVSVGDNVKLECESPRGNPKPTVYWKKEGTRFNPDGERIRIEKGDLIISSASRADTGSYSCVATNMAGIRESLKAILSVHVPPVFTVRPKDEKVQVGDDVELTCQASGDPTPRISWDKVDGTRSSRAVLLSNHNLRISGIQPEDAGDYLCTANNVVKTIKSSATITVDEPYVTPFITPPKDVTARIGETVKIPCVVGGSPRPHIVWRHKESNMLSGTRYKDGHISITANGELTIYNARFGDQGKYTCEAFMPKGQSVQGDARVTVLSRDHTINPPVITRGPSNQTVAVGSSLEFKCDSAAVPVPEFTWTKDGDEIESGNRFSIASSGAVTISNVQNGDAGKYTCTATTDYGWSNWQFWIKVAPRGSPSLTPGGNSRELPAAPSAPSFVNSTASTITLSWNAVVKAGTSPAVGYILEYYCLEDNVSTWTRVLADLIRQTVYTVTNLGESSNCVFVVRSQNERGTSYPSKVSDPYSTKAKSSDVELAEKLSQISIHVTDVQASGSGKSTTVIHWEPPIDCSVIDGYRIYAQAVSIAGQNPIVDTADCFGNSKELELESRVYYEIRVRPYKANVQGRFSPIVIAYPPSGDIQLERLTLNAKATPSQDTSKYTVSFSWRPPPNILPEYISHYTIRCYDISDAKDAYDVTKRLNSSNAALVLRNLPRDRSYSAYVTFSTTLGEGVQSDVVDFSTSAAANAGAMNDIFKNPAILAGIAACVLLIIGIIVGVLVYRRYKKNKKGRGLHARSIQIDEFVGTQYTRGFTMNFASSGGNNNYSDGTGSSAGRPNGGKIYKPGMADSSVMTRNTTVSMNNSNGNVGTTISPKVGDMRSAQRQHGSFSYVTDQLTNMSSIHPQFSSPNVERAQTQAGMHDPHHYHRGISEAATIPADEYAPHSDLIDMTTPTRDERYMTGDRSLPPPPPSPPMSHKTSFSDRTSRSHGSSRASADQGSNHSGKARRSRERNRTFRPLDHAPTDTDTGIDSPQQTPSPPRPGDPRSGHHPSSLPLRTRLPHYSYAPQSTSRIRNDAIAAEYARNAAPNYGYYGAHESESDFDGSQRTNYIALPEGVRNSVTASSVSMMNAYDSESNCSERSPSPASSEGSLLESVSQVGVNPNSLAPAIVPFVPAPSGYPHGDSIPKHRHPKPKLPKRQCTFPHYDRTDGDRPRAGEQFLNRVNSASSSASSSSFHQNTADSGMSAGVGSCGHNSLNSNSSGGGSKKVAPRAVSNDDDEYRSDARRVPALRGVSKTGAKSPQRKKSKDSVSSLPNRDGPAYIDYEIEAECESNPMTQEYCTNEQDLESADESRTAFLAAKSVFVASAQKNARARFPELSDVPEVSTSDFYSDRSQ